MSVRRNLVANYFGAVWTAAVGLVMLPVYLRYLGIESYGLIGFFVTLQAWVALLDMGLTPALNREMARFSAGQHAPQSIRDLLRSMELVYAGIAVTLGIAIVALAPLIATGWLNPRGLPPEAATRALALMGGVLAIQWIGTLYRSAALGLQDQVWLNAATVVSVTVRALGTVAVLELVAASIDAFFVFQCALSLAETAVLGLHVHHRLPVPPRPERFSLEALRGVWRFAAGLTGITLLSTLLTQVDKVLLAKLLPLDQFGYFSLAVAVAGALSTLIGPIHNVAYPRLSTLVVAGSVADLAKEYHRFAQLLAIAVLPAALVLAVFAHEIVLLWTRSAETARQVAPILAVWVAGTALNGVMHVPYAAQLAHGWSRLTVIVNAVAVVIMIPVTLLLVPVYGAVAAAWIWVCINLGYVLFAITAMHVRILPDEKWSWYRQDLLGPLLAGVVAVAAMRALHQTLLPLERPGQFGFLLFSAAITFAAVLAATPAGLAMLRALPGLVHALKLRKQHERP